ncbi:hypothetical protein MAR_002728 [Mya arenaria]|uniref:Uncharacterized protein n=1 Tax=Mya arenaria TaxID=6604 RepID=A0ABY7G4S0_MYAAR|nr:hypothetical protein MAR_002728 [Mya arenaria]
MLLNDDELTNSKNCSLDKQHIDDSYKRICDTLIKGANSSFPKRSIKRFLKPYWSETLTREHMSMWDACELWRRAGRPKVPTDVMFIAYKSAKHKFRLAQRQCIEDNQQTTQLTESCRPDRTSGSRTFSEDTCAKIARYTIEKGLIKASRRFTSDINKMVSETTVRSMWNNYMIKNPYGEEPTVLAYSPRGGPTLLVLYRTIRRAHHPSGAPYQRRYYQPEGQTLAVQLMVFVKGKGIKAEKTLTADFYTFKDNIVSKVQVHGMINEHFLALNFFQTGCSMMPDGE